MPTSRPGWAAAGLLAAAAVVAVTAPADQVTPIDNGLARTPPTGWNSWNQVGCAGLTEDVVKRAADSLVGSAYRYVVVDDCWQALERDAAGNLAANPDRFPGGMRALADYVHARGLLFGIYASPGTATCAMAYGGYPGTNLGSYGHEKQDAGLFAAWGVDYLKYDWCDADANAGLSPVAAYAEMRDALLATGRPIVYSISEWGEFAPWKWAPGIANLWRTTTDLYPDWGSLSANIEAQFALARAGYHGGPGGWQDPDMLQVGNGSLTDTENRTHLSIWAMMAAPLFLGTSPAGADMSLLGNSSLLAVDQDPLGVPATVSTSADGTSVLTRPLADGGQAVALYNPTDAPVAMTTPDGQLSDLWSGAVSPGGGTVDVPAHGTVVYHVTR